MVLNSCVDEPPKKEAVLYQKYCASCHIAPKIDELPKAIWENHVLPDMVGRMQIEEMYQNPNHKTTGVRPKIKLGDWISLKNYIISMAPEELPSTPTPKAEVLSGFRTQAFALDTNNGSLNTLLRYDLDENKVLLGDVYGTLRQFDFMTGNIDTLYQGETPITDHHKVGGKEIITEVGILDPSELAKGTITVKENNDTLRLPDTFHRPVHNLIMDLNGDGSLEMVVSEFGNETGRLSLLVEKDGVHKKRTLLNQPGCIRTLAKDMDNDGTLDIITLTSQGNESITILYQRKDLRFEARKVLEFSPVYGSSWFELVDYNGDGFDDIITVNGDNADKSYVHKPYHGMRIHLNDGQNRFKEAYFHPLNGATRLAAADFDQDGDIDFALVSTFPDYGKAPQRSFVYLENKESKKFRFQANVLERPNLGRWFLMDTGDVDADGDLDILLSPFTYAFTPVPEYLTKQWASSNTDLVILENLLN